MRSSLTAGCDQGTGEAENPTVWRVHCNVCGTGVQGQCQQQQQPQAAGKGEAAVLQQRRPRVRPVVNPKAITGTIQHLRPASPISSSSSSTSQTADEGRLRCRSHPPHRSCRRRRSTDKQPRKRTLYTSLAGAQRWPVQSRIEHSPPVESRPQHQKPADCRITLRQAGR